MPDGSRPALERRTQVIYNHETAETALRLAKKRRARESEVLEQFGMALKAKDAVVAEAVKLTRSAARNSKTGSNPLLRTLPKKGFYQTVALG